MSWINALKDAVNNDAGAWIEHAADILSECARELELENAPSDIVYAIESAADDVRACATCADSWTLEVGARDDFDETQVWVEGWQEFADEDDVPPAEAYYDASGVRHMKDGEEVLA